MREGADGEAAPPRRAIDRRRAAASPKRPSSRRQAAEPAPRQGPAPSPRAQGCAAELRSRLRSSRTARRWSSARSTTSRRSPKPSPPRKPSPSRSAARSKKAAAEAEVAVPEPAPPEAPPAETADEEAAPAKPARKRATKAKATPPAQAGRGDIPARGEQRHQHGRRRRWAAAQRLVAAHLRLTLPRACKARGTFNRPFTGRNGKRPAMKSPVARFARLLMLALMLVVSTWQPAAAQDSDAGPSILRDTETELLFKDISRPMIVAAGLDPEQRQRRAAQRSRDQRLRRDRPDGLCPDRPARGGGQREPAARRDRARARPRRRRPFDPPPARREGSDRA